MFAISTHAAVCAIVNLAAIDAKKVPDLKGYAKEAATTFYSVID